MNKYWTEDELKDSLVAYLEMLTRIEGGEKVTKHIYYRILSSKHGRTIKSIEYRMQNISYIMILHGRNYVPGLAPAKNVGKNVIEKIEKILSIIEQRPVNEDVIFESKVNEVLCQKYISKPEGIKKPNKRELKIFDYERDSSVKAWVLRNANGICENCLQVAPFNTKIGEPFLEVHHVRRLSDNGSDTPENAVALCPNCHKEIHFGEKSHLIQESLYRNIHRLIKEN
jgi:5-methylcytosine-specific restriction protein A